MIWLAALLAVALLGIVGLRWFVRASPRDLVTAGRAFVAAFSALAGTGLLFTGRIGLALVALAAAVMAVRAVRAGKRGADPAGGPAPEEISAIETALLRMRLDRRTGAVDGEVQAGSLAGRDLASLGRGDLLALLAEAHRDDPPSVQILEAYLDRRYPDWRAARGADEAGGAASLASGMDEATALKVLGLTAGASRDQVKAAHRRLMGQLHPDRGGTDFLASQINRAKEVLLGNRGVG